jgi:hypothetical protein
VQETVGGTSITMSTRTVLAPGTTYHVAVTKSGSTVSLFIDGVLDRTQTFSGAVATTTSPVRIGMRDGSKALGGRIDEVAIYGTALSAARVQAHADAA